MVEYNYEPNGEIVVPAGTKVFGHLDSADRTGYIGVRFDSLLMPDGSSINMDGTATDLQLRALRGKVEGKHRSQNILVRSAAGVGEIVATLAGRGSLDQPLSEGDLLRERVSNNIAQASDEQVNKPAIGEHLVVSLLADTGIYVILLKATKRRAAVAYQSSIALISSWIAPEPDRQEQLLRPLQRWMQHVLRRGPSNYLASLPPPYSITVPTAFKTEGLASAFARTLM
ncbi:MAG TPA: hypothetical protein VKY31_09905 [Terriglobia bacterium]|nr:hypothetical protein [Terriglobia bacterium]